MDGELISELRERVERLERHVENLPPDPHMLYTVNEVAQRFRCGKSNVYDLIEGRHLAVVRVGVGRGGVRVRGSDLQAFLDSRKEGGPSPQRKFKHLAGYLP